MLTTLLDGRAFAERFGSGEPRVVALHGWGRTRHDWRDVLAAETGADGAGVGEFDALALDLPGFGATPPPATAWRTEEYADFLADLLSGLERPVLLGHSFGGRVAVRLAATRPELVRGLVLTGVPLYRTHAYGKPRMGYRLARSLYANGLIGEGRMERYRKKYGTEEYRNARGLLREILLKTVNEEYAAQVEAVAAAGVPTRLVWGEHDTAAPRWMAERAAGVLGVDLRVIPGAGHEVGGTLVAALRSATTELLGGSAGSRA